MMITKKKKVANPHSSHRRTKPAKKRRMSAKQIKHFGTKRQKAALKASRTRKRASNPVKRSVTKRRATATKRKRNPAQLITLGFMNPHKPAKKRKKKNPMATTKRRRRTTAKAAPRRRRRRATASNPVRRRRRTVRASNPRRRRKNATRIVVMSPRRRRRSNPTRRRVTVRRRSSGRRRNPELFGRSVGVTEMTKQVLGGLVGVTIVKTVPSMLPAAATSSPILATATSVVTALAAGYITGKMFPDLASAVMFGGLMQAGSVLLNQFLPSVGSTIGLSGLGNLVGPASFPVPQNPLRPGTVVAMPAPSSPRIGSSGMGRAFKSAF